MDIDRMPEEMRALCLRAARAIVETAAARQQLAATRQETRALIAQAQQNHLDDARIPAQPAIEAPPPTVALDAHEAQLQAARAIRGILNDFPFSSKLLS